LPVPRPAPRKTKVVVAKSKKGPAAVPKSLTAKERHPFLAKVRASLAKRYGPTRMNELFEVVDLGWYLAALGRDDEARTLMGEVSSSIVFDGNFNLWSPVANALCLAARLTQASAPKKALIARVVENPAWAVMSRKDFNATIERALAQLADAEGYPGMQRVACQLYARGLQTLSYFSETAGHGLSYDTWYDRPRLDGAITKAIAALGHRLG
jgi:hypothetical protein